jgi:hypothetical protein
LDATIDTVTAREELAATDTSIPEEHVKNVGLAGTRDASGYEVSGALCGMIKKATGAPVRGGTGRLFAPPVFRASELDAGGFDPSGNYHPALDNMSGDMEGSLTGVGSVLGVGGSTLDPVVYSKTRRNRGDANWFFQITGCPVSTRQHWLESRES